MVLVFLSLVLMTFIVGFNNFIIYTVRGCCILSSTQIWICTNPNVKLTLLAPSSFPKGQWQYAIGMKSEMRNAHEWSCKAIVQLLVFPKGYFPFSSNIQISRIFLWICVNKYIHLRLFCFWLIRSFWQERRRIERRQMDQRRKKQGPRLQRTRLFENMCLFISVHWFKMRCLLREMIFLLCL